MSAATAYDRLIDALGEHGSKVRANGTSAMAQCPVADHDDRDPSLSLRRIEGSVLVHHHGPTCTTDDVLDALDLTKSDLFDEPKGATYTYGDGRVVHRSPDKQFRQSGKTKGIGELFRLDRVRQAVASGQPVAVVEGEKDVLAVESLGATATCAPQGAGRWHTVDPSPLHGGHVVVVADRDQPGEAHARDVVSSLTSKAASLRVVQAKVGKDAADHIAAGHGLDELEAAELPTGDTEADVVMPLDVICAADVELSRVRYLWDRRIPVGAVTVLPGEEGIGKTTVGIRLIADLTRGKLAGEFYGTPRNVLVLAAEDGLGDVFVPRLRQAGADLNRVHIVRARMAVDGSGRDVIVPRDLDVIGDEVRKHDAALVWIDSLVTTLPDELKAISYKDVARALKAIGTWASDEGVAVAAPWHLNKAQGTDTAVRMMDSRAFRTAVRSVLLIVTDPEAPEGTVGGLVALDKANAGTLAVPALRYHLQPSPYTLEEVDQATGEVHEVAASCGVAVWRGEVAGDGREIARAALAPKIEREDGPDAWLRDYLAGAGEIPRADVVAAAELVKISESAVKRAARKIGVHSREESGRDPVSNRPWKRALWTLPEQSGQQSGHPYPTDPTDPTGEAFIDPTDPIYAGQEQSGQSGQSGQRGPTAPIEACKWTDWTMPLTPPPAHCATCDVELSAERAGRNLRCETCWDELLANQPEATA